jgi:hypothetical protein
MPIPESPARQVAYHGNERNSTAAAAQLRFGRPAGRTGTEEGAPNKPPASPSGTGTNSRTPPSPVPRLRQRRLL